MAETRTLKDWSWKDWTIGALGLLVLALGGIVAGDRLGEAGFFSRTPEGEPVSVFDVILDRQELAYLDILFDRPIGEGREGEILAEPPATLSPAVGGVWRWRDASVLRFEPSGRFVMATQYTLALIPERLLGEGQSLLGPGEFSLTTDQFLVETVEASEEPATGTGAPTGAVVFRGEIRFNYPVDPRELASHLTLLDPGATPVEVFFETTWPSTVVGYRTAPVTKRPAERELALTIDGALTPDEGNVPLGETFTWPIPVGSSERLAVRKLAAAPGERESVLTLTFSSPVSAQAAQGAVAVEPAVSFRVSARGNEVVLTGEFVPGESYRVGVAQGLAAADGAILQEGWGQQVRLANLDPSAHFEGEGMFLSARGARALAIETINVNQVDLTVDRVYRNNLFALFQYQSWQLGSSGYRGSSVPRSLGDRIAAESLKIPTSRNRRVSTSLKLDRFLAEGEPGLYRVAISRPGDWQTEQRWVLVTEIGLLAKRSTSGEISVWALSFADLSALSGVRIRLLSDQNQTLAEGTSDASGFVRLGGEAVTDGVPYLLLAERGGDMSFLFFDYSGVDLTGLDVAGASPAAEGYDAFLYGERDLYRPGEVVEGVAVVRDRRVRPAPAMPVVLAHRDPTGQERDSQRLEVGAQGLVPFRIEVPAYARTGYHSLELRVGDTVLGTYRFQVEDFIPDRIKVEITPPETSPGPGEALPFTVRGAWLFGPPASGLAVAGRVRLAAAPFSPEGFEGFRFENPERSFDGLELLAEQAELDSAGTRLFSATVPPGLAPPSSLVAVVTARVQERGGRGVTALARIPVHPYPCYLGLRRSGEGYAEPNQETTFEWVAVAPDGSRARAGSLRVEIYRDRWNTVLRRTPEGGVRYESVRDPELVSTRAIAGGEEGGTFPFTPERYGAYRAVITDLGTGASAQVEFYASGWGFSPWAIKSPGRVELDLDRAEYRPGETATVQVRAPFPGKLLLTVERDGVLETRIETLTGNTASLTFTVQPSWRPNVYVTATLVRPAGELAPGTPGRAFGAVPLEVDRAEKRLPLSIQAPAEMRPENSLAIRIDTAPGAAVTVAAVDEGILRLIAQKTPDPFAFFYRKLALGVISYDTFALLLPEVGAPSPGGDEGGEGRAQYVSTASMLRVEPAAFWSGVLTADASGRAEARFDVPPFQGQLRVMAVGVDGDRFVSEEASVTVRDRLVVLPTLPRFLQLGDRLEVPVTVRNDTGRDGEIEVEVAWEAPGGAKRSETARLTVADGAEGTAYVPITMGEIPGVLPFTVTAKGNGERTRARASVPLRPSLPPLRRLAAGSLAASAQKVKKDLGGPGGDLRPETVTRTLAVGPLPLLRFGGRLTDLLRYPYGCLEQTTSRTFPLLYLSDLARRLEPELFEQGEPEVLVEEGLARIASFQLPGGGFGMWQDASASEPWVSLYATHLLVEAREAGHAVSYNVIEEALGYTGRAVSAKARYGADELARATYALYILSRAGRPDLGTMDFLREKHRTALDRGSRALLAAAYAGAGNPQAAEELAAGIEVLDDLATATAGSGGGAGGTTYASALRDRALLLLALLDVAPEDSRIPALVDRLAREAEAVGPWTTQEAGFAFVALGRLVHLQEEQPPIAGEVYLGERRLGTFGGDEIAVFRDLGGTEPLRIELAGASGEEGGIAYYSLITRGVPTDAGFRPERAGLEVERTFLNRDGSRADLDAIGQGDLLVLKTRIRTTAGPVSNVVVASLLPPGLEVENPRLKSSETLTWITDANLEPASLDLRDDRILAFTDLPANSWRTLYTLVRSVVPGTFRLPPVSAEAMYNPGLRATGERGEIRVRVRE